MIDRVQTKGKVVRAEISAGRKENLPYCIELRGSDGAAVERLLARAFNAVLARTIFRAAQGEHPDRRITLSHGRRLIADSGRIALEKDHSADE